MHSKFKANISNMKPCLKDENKLLCSGRSIRHSASQAIHSTKPIILSTQTDVSGPYNAGEFTEDFLYIFNCIILADYM